MHELGVTQEILTQVLKAAQQNRARKVTAVRLKIGDFTTIEPESVRFYFTQIAKETLAESAELEIEKVPILMNCRVCRKEFSPSDNPPLLLCPECGGGEVEMLKGRELQIEDIEIEE